MSTKPHSVTVFPWLRENLGKDVLACLGGQDVDALRAAVEIVNIDPYALSKELSAAFATVVLKMQPRTRFIAFHAIAHVADWSYRSRIWEAAGLPAVENPGRCKHEPKFQS